VSDESYGKRYQHSLSASELSEAPMEKLFPSFVEFMALLGKFFGGRTP
jgi:hypothetical protein